MDWGSNLAEGEANNLYDDVNALKGELQSPDQTRVPARFQPLVNQIKSSPPVKTKEGKQDDRGEPKNRVWAFI